MFHRKNMSKNRGTHLVKASFLTHLWIWGATYRGWQLAAFVPADPAQAADDIEHLELELRNK